MNRGSSRRGKYGPARPIPAKHYITGIAAQPPAAITARIGHVVFPRSAHMAWVDTVGLLAVVQLFVFGVMVGRARGKYGVAAPATAGHPIFERYYRVQMNTVESLLVF